MSYLSDAKTLDIHSALVSDFLAGFSILDQDGQNSGIAGHITARIKDSEQVLGHQYGLAFDEVDEQAVRLTDFDLEEAAQGQVSPSLAFHIALYRARPDIGAIVHTHPDQVIAFSAANGQFIPVFQSALMLHDQVVHYTDYDGIVESEALGDKFARHLGDRQILLLKNHGLISVGRSVRHAVCAAVIFHQNCHIQLEAMKAGSVQGFSDMADDPDILLQASAFLNRDRIIDMRWDQLVRRALA
jgi:L-fuculose-phosphate aldolase